MKLKYLEQCLDFMKFSHSIKVSMFAKIGICVCFEIKEILNFVKSDLFNKTDSISQIEIRQFSSDFQFFENGAYLGRVPPVSYRGHEFNSFDCVF